MRLLTQHTITPLIGVLVAGVVVTGCANLLLRGGSSHSKGPPPNAIATFIVPRCIDKVSGAIIPGVAGSFYLARAASGQFELFELDKRGRGTRITNYWRDPQGHHWNVFKRGDNAYSFTIPNDQKAVGWRYVYAAKEYTVDGPEKGAFRLLGKHVAECAMIPVDSQGNAMATAPLAGPDKDELSDAGVSEPEAAPSACVPGATQACYGAGACQGGQACLEDGSGFGACDCGVKQQSDAGSHDAAGNSGG